MTNLPDWTVPSPFEGLPERKPFTASRREIWTALAMYFAAYLYCNKYLFLGFDGSKGAVWLIVFTMLLIGITPANLSVLKTGKAKAIRFSTLMALCRELDCQPGDLLEFVEE